MKKTRRIPVLRETISAGAAQRFYDRLGAKHDWAEFCQGEARQQALQLLEVTPGQMVLNAG
jgi:hypothetical protein